MSWIQKLYDSYPNIAAKDELNELWPTAHLKKNAHIEITIDGDGNFKRVNQLAGEDAYTLIPVTEKSAARTGNIEPHPLSEELSYCAFDLPDVKKKEERNKAYSDLLEEWSKSEHTHPKVIAVYKFVSKAQVWHLIKDSFEFPLLFKSKSASIKIEPEKCFIRWRVEITGISDSSTWNDESLIDSWQSFEKSINPKSGFCYVTGNEEVRVAILHPKYVRNSGDGARIISRNDWEAFTFLGRFTDEKDAVTTKNKASQVCEISFDVTQKAHNALRWLINRQSVRNGDQAIVTWAISGKPVPEPIRDPFDFDDDEDLSPVDDATLQALTTVDNTPDLSSDLGRRVAAKIKRKLKGYYQNLGEAEQLSIMAIDSATPGRMAVTYYQEQLSKDYFNHLDDWYEHFSWYQRYNKEIPVEGKKPKIQLTWPIVPPPPYSIAQAAYGDVLKSQDTLKKQLYSRLLPCIAEGKTFPKDIVDLCVARASNPNSGEHWEWERNVGVACALYRGYFSRHPDENKRRKFYMALDESNHNRDYLYGRLLAIAEDLEQYALYLADEKRSTNAERYMQIFSERPFSTWPKIYLALKPYKDRLNNNRKEDFVFFHEKDITEIQNKFQRDDFVNDSKLSGEFLLGYHCQKMAYFDKRQKVLPKTVVNN